MSATLIKQAQVVNEGNIIRQDVLMKDGRFEKIASSISSPQYNFEEVNGEELYLMPGLIDDQVHFREPGLTHKATIATEARASVAGGTTTFMEMPNVKPPSLNRQLLEEKYSIASRCSLANYSFFMGVSNDNAEDALIVNKYKQDICGLKIFMGSSTGNMLVDNIVTLEKVFSESEVLIATHCEQEQLIANNMQKLLQEGHVFDHARYHPIIRNEDTCYESSLSTIQLAKKHNTRLHILHISTQKELALFSNMLPLHQKRITAEVCVHHLHFTSDDYEQYGNFIKCNPAIKAPYNKEALWIALLNDTLDILATDHAPHTLEEKSKPYLEAPAGVPLIQHSLLMLLQAHKEGRISLEKIVEKACHAPAICFQVKERGYIREGYFADAVLVDFNKHHHVTKESLLYKCAWSPFVGHTFPAAIDSTYVNGVLKYKQGNIVSDVIGMRASFDR